MTPVAFELPPQLRPSRQRVGTLCELTARILAIVLSQLRTIRSRLHDGVADATIETMDAMFARMLRGLTEFVTRGGPVH